MVEKSSKKKRKSFRRELTEWGVLVAGIAIIYFSGLHVPIVGNLQRVLLWTGLMTPDTNLSADGFKKANYNIPLLSVDGDAFTMQEFKGKTIFLNFWATWCPPCIAEMPNIQSLYEDVNSDSIEFVMLSLDEDHSKAKKYLAKKEFTFPVYFLNGAKPGTYSSTVVPTTYIISPEGQIVAERRGMANYNTKRFKEFLRSF